LYCSLLLLLLLVLQVNLRAAVDHMHGVACAVQQVPTLLLLLVLLPLLQVNLRTAANHRQSLRHTRYGVYHPSGWCLYCCCCSR
jgi:hypothetical protein